MVVTESLLALETLAQGTQNYPAASLLWHAPVDLLQFCCC